jgi:hypothetical protein
MSDDVRDVHLCMGAKEYNGSSAIVSCDTVHVTFEVLPLARHNSIQRKALLDML